MPLFTPDELRTWLRYDPASDFDDAGAELVEKVVAGWLTDALDAPPSQWTDPTGIATIKAWALELGGIAYENPTSLRSDAAGDVAAAWFDTRADILARARRWATARRNPTTRPGTTPAGAFPPPRPWPDPTLYPPAPTWRNGNDDYTHQRDR